MLFTKEVSVANDLTDDERQVLRTFRRMKTPPNDYLPSPSISEDFYRYNKTDTAAAALKRAYDGLIEKGYLTHNAGGGLPLYYLTQSGYDKANE
jgi:hypothetical protein